MNKKKDMLYLGVDFVKVYDDYDQRGMMSSNGLKWIGTKEWWATITSGTSVILYAPTLKMMKKLLNLDVWPEPGEILVLDIVSGEGWIYSHKQYKKYPRSASSYHEAAPDCRRRHFVSS